MLSSKFNFSNAVWLAPNDLFPGIWMTADRSLGSIPVTSVTPCQAVFCFLLSTRWIGAFLLLFSARSFLFFPLLSQLLYLVEKRHGGEISSLGFFFFLPSFSHSSLPFFYFSHSIFAVGSFWPLFKKGWHWASRDATSLWMRQTRSAGLSDLRSRGWGFSRLDFPHKLLDRPMLTVIVVLCSPISCSSLRSTAIVPTVSHSAEGYTFPPQKTTTWCR